MRIIVIWKKKNVDTVYMEIINYSENKGNNSAGLLRKATYYRDRERKSFNIDALSGTSRAISVKEILENAHGAAVHNGKVLKRFLRWLWLIPAIAVCVAAPYTIIKMLSYKDNFVSSVPLDDDLTTETNILNESLANFALQPTAYFDNEGNVMNSDGSAVESNISFKDPVSFQTYKVQAGDTISGISVKFGLSNISTLIAVNNISNVRELYSGQKLKIPSMDGLLHTVSSGESLEGLSVKYNVTVEDLLDVNDLESSMLTEGQSIFIPGARMESLALQKAMGEIFIYPIKAAWRLTSKFGARPDPFTGVAGQFHGGIDMACPKGTPIYSAMSGTVVTAGYSNVYGNYVIIKHIDGYQTLYGHMSKITTKKGSYVSQGVQIGLVGSTGYSTGPHLHFTVYKDGKRIDPLTVLK